MGYIDMNHSKKPKPMTAFRFAALYNIPIKYYEEYLQYDKWRRLGTYSFYCTNPSGQAALGTSIRQPEDAVIAVSHEYRGQLIKEVSIWHELGHYIDTCQYGDEAYFKLPILLREARASMIAITLMKQHNRWQEYKRVRLLSRYKSYTDDFSTEHSYRYLIEEA